MDDLDFAILEFLFNSPRHESDTKALYDQNFDSFGNVKTALDDMLNADDPYIARCVGKEAFFVTKTGIKAYKLEKEIRKHHAEQQKQQRFQNKISVASVLVPTITFFCGLIVESCFRIVDWVIALFT